MPELWTLGGKYDDYGITKTKTNLAELGSSFFLWIGRFSLTVRCFSDASDYFGLVQNHGKRIDGFRGSIHVLADLLGLCTIAHSVGCPASPKEAV